ncbi:MAG: hypothetical protein ACYCUM_03715 [Solirubrobacteraceae bacterium]
MPAELDSLEDDVDAADDVDPLDAELELDPFELPHAASAAAASTTPAATRPRLQIDRRGRSLLNDCLTLSPLISIPEREDGGASGARSFSSLCWNGSRIGRNLQSRSDR